MSLYSFELHFFCLKLPPTDNDKNDQVVTDELGSRFKIDSWTHEDEGE
jgi:hypothetical protein